MILAATILSIVAAMYVARGKALIANVIWSCTNVVIIWYNYSIGELEMVLLFGAYQCIALYGVWNLGLKWRYKRYVSGKKMDKMIKEYKENKDD